eukprot:jgi/Pico_ML_1/55978/g1581.t1
MAPPPSTPLSQATNLPREEDDGSRRKRNTPSGGEENAAPVHGTPSGALSHLSRLRARVDVMRRESVAHSYSDGPLLGQQSPWKKADSPNGSVGQGQANHPGLGGPPPPQQTNSANTNSTAHNATGPGAGGHTWTRLRAALALFESTSFLSNCEAALSGKPRAPKSDFAAQKLEYQNLVKQLRACLRDTFAKKDALAREAVAIEGELSSRLEALQAELLVEKESNTSIRKRFEQQESQFKAELEEARKNAGLTSAEAQARLEKVLQAEAEIEKAEAAIEAQREALYQEEKARIGKEMGARGAALLAEVEAKKTKLEEKQAKMMQEAEEMRAEVSQMEHDMKLVAAEAEDARAKAAAFEHSQEVALAQLHALKDEFTSFEQQSRAAMDSLKQTHEKEKADLTHVLEESCNKATVLEENLELLKSKAEKTETDLRAELEKKIADWESQRSDLEEELEQEKREAHVKITELEGQLELFQDKYSAQLAVSGEREAELQHALQQAAVDSKNVHDTLQKQLEELESAKVGAEALGAS